ncbi:chemotaxis protein CheW (plasmid) [Pontibacillus sp. ALD_SL1]|uniref:chemotaxis protein CheW n=1 Tax=Pontibacillus sp. ALD_SL1 TaxID=2777185 RepID=UPI001A972343|nr:chemotaxis protein CheW [Pontibacillus sp. ALD_SL1]QST03057.1 chemotaxis protein CheW [Pontibacillus sp. ALD_SL1]
MGKHVIFRLNKEVYAIHAKDVLRIESDKKVRPIPNTPPEFKGVITVEEDTVELFDLRIKFNISSNQDKDIPYIIVCREPKKGTAIGFVVDSVEEVRDIPDDVELSTISDTISGTSTEYIHGIYRPSRDQGDDNGNSISKNEDELIIILNLEKLLPQRAE